MHRATSIYLDATRFVAAMMVFVGHAAYTRLGGAWIGGFGGFAHDGVVIFFVLSGYVIGYTTESRHTTPEDYAVSRLARLWSVVLPALLLTVALDSIGSRLDPHYYDAEWYQPDRPVLRFGANLFFVSELWLWSVRPFSNGPFWSVAYEAWYYVFFGAWYFTRGRTRIVATSSVALIMGPKILLLMPLWWMGFAAYRVGRWWAPPRWIGAVMALGSVVVYAILHQLKVSSWGAFWMVQQLPRSIAKGLDWGLYAPGDALLAFVVAIHFAGIAIVAPSLDRGLSRLEGPTRFFAGRTFTLYLCHYPLLQLFWAWTGSSTIGIVGTFASVIVLGHLFEGSKPLYARSLRSLIRALGR